MLTKVLLMRVLTHPVRLIKAGVFLLSGILLMVEPALSEEWIPVYEEPRHRAVFDNDHCLLTDAIPFIAPLLVAYACKCRII